MTYYPILKTAEPFFFPGGENGILLVHGFTGTPKEVRWMGEFLAAQGHTVCGVRLAGHATHEKDLLPTRWVDWLNCVEDGYHLLNSSTKRVFIMGLSLGGVLTLLVGARFPQAGLPLAGLVAMSTPYALPPDPRLPYIQWLHWLMPSVPKGPSDTRNLEALQGHVDYLSYPTRAILQVRDVLVELRASLPHVAVPVLLVHSRQDSSVAPENAEHILAALGSPEKEVLWLENSGHVVTEEPERQQVFQAAHDFIQKHSLTVA